MTVEAELVSRLTGFAGVSAIVGSDVFNGQAPAGQGPPYITFFRVSAERPSAMVQDAGIVSARFQFDCWAGDATTMQNLRNEVRKALQRYSTSSGTIIQQVFIDGEQDEGPDEATAPLLYHGSVDALVHYEE